MFKIIVKTPDQLDLDELVNLQKIAFAQVVANTDMDYILVPAHYQWKYQTPYGTAKTALIYEGDSLVAMNSMYPLQVADGERTYRAWQSCDTATHPSARGKGYFMKCLAALKAELGPDELFLGFPNKNSRPGLTKFGWTHRGDIHTWVRVLPGRRQSRFGEITELAEFGAAQDAFFSELRAAGGPLLDRSAAYLTWRYKRHTLNHYDAYALSENGRQTGLLVMRSAKVLGRKLAVAMELLTLNDRAERRLMNYSAAWASAHRLRYAFLHNNTVGNGAALSCGFIPIPMWAMPKRQILMGAANGPATERVWAREWRLGIGDWDVF